MEREKRPSGDLRILYATAFLSALSTGLTGVLLGLYLAKIRFDAAQIGYVIAAGMAGGAAATLLVTLAGDRLGRRRVLMGLAFLGGMGGMAAAFASVFHAILAAALRKYCLASGSLPKTIWKFWKGAFRSSRCCISRRQDNRCLRIRC